MHFFHYLTKVVFFVGLIFLLRPTGMLCNETYIIIVYVTVIALK